MKLKNKVMIVTGANGGMGKQLVEDSLAEGAIVAGFDLAENAPISNDRYFYQRVDLSVEEDVNRAFSEVMMRFDQVDALVNLAGIAQSATPLEDVTLEDWERIHKINSTSVFLTCKAASRVMKKAGSGSIVNVASVSTVRPRPGLNAYIASKGAVVSFTEAIAIELAEYGIRANVLHPGPADTAMISQFAGVDQNIDEVKENVFKKSVPLGRLIRPEDISTGIIYLCSDDASMVTGTTLRIDGGRGL